MLSAAASDSLVVKIAGQQVSGWTSYRVTRGVERLPSGLVLEFTERYPGEATPAIIVPGKPCTVSIGGDLVLTGYADLYWPHFGAAQHLVRAELRSKTADIVDCSLAPPTAMPPWVFQGGTIGEIATRLAKPFGITVAGDGANTPLDTRVVFPVNAGETVAELLENMARTAQVLMWDDAEGRLIFSNAGTTRAGSGLVEGVNCEVEEARLSMDQRFSDIYVVGQAPEQTSGHVNIWAHVNDPSVSRYRPKLIVMDGVAADADYARKRARWEVARRYGRSRVADVIVAGHRDGAGRLWQVNTIVSCELPSLKITGDMLIAEAAYLGSDAGTSTLLTVMPREGFIPQPFYYPDPLGGYQPGGAAGAANPGTMGTGD